MAGKKESKKKTREFKIDLWDVLRNADKNNLNYYESLSVDERKEFFPLVLMRWLSTVSNENPNVEHYIIAVNDIVNIGFFDLAKFPDLQWKLMAMCGIGSSQRHEWIKAPSKMVTNRFDNLILQMSPSLNNLELELAKSKFTKAGLEQLCRDFAMEDNEIKPIIDEFNKYQANKTKRA